MSFPATVAALTQRLLIFVDVVYVCCHCHCVRVCRLVSSGYRVAVASLLIGSLAIPQAPLCRQTACLSEPRQLSAASPPAWGRAMHASWHQVCPSSQTRTRLVVTSHWVTSLRVLSVPPVCWSGGSHSVSVSAVATSTGAATSTPSMRCFEHLAANESTTRSTLMQGPSAMPPLLVRRSPATLTLSLLCARVTSSSCR